MEKEKLYFESIDENTCYPLENFITDARIEGLKQITLVEAIPDNNNPDYIWCTYEGEVTERGNCKKAVCPYYESTSGRGVCKHRGKLYDFGEEKTFEVPPKN